MKKVVALFSIFAFVAIMGTSLNAQNYFTYDGDDFNVYIKTNSSNSQVLEIYFTDAAKSKWVQFNIVDYYNLENTSVPGFQYVVTDVQGNKFYFDYFRNADYVTVSNPSGTSWTLYRRQ